MKEGTNEGVHVQTYMKGNTTKVQQLRSVSFCSVTHLASLLSQTPTHKSRMFSRFFHVLTERVRCEKMVLNETSSLTWRQFVWFMRLRCQERNNCLLIEPSAATLSA